MFKEVVRGCSCLQMFFFLQPKLHTRPLNSSMPYYAMYVRFNFEIFAPCFTIWFQNTQQFATWWPYIALTPLKCHVDIIVWHYILNGLVSALRYHHLLKGGSMKSRSVKCCDWGMWDPREEHHKQCEEEEGKAKSANSHLARKIEKGEKEGRKEGRTNGWMDKWMIGWMNEWILCLSLLQK